MARHDSEQRPRSLRQALREQRTLLGTFVMELPVRATVEAVARAGLDFVVVDQEHAPTSLGEVQHLIACARAERLHVVVRSRAGDLSSLTAILDMRPDGLMIPGIASAEAARAVVAAARYHPLGSRGVAPLIRHEGAFASVDEALALIVQIESADAVGAVSEIAAIPGIDCIFVGPYDLSQSLGAVADVNAPAVREAAAGIAARASETVAVGAHMPNAAVLRDWAGLGFGFLTYRTDGQLLEAGCAVAAADVAAAFGGGNPSV
ncbi:MAG TPA: aldolase/citrate lyase family protein [Conexibacter sp.]|nr:aldolase/citrate lyase family protein [Conexibacter sp.]